MVDAKHIFWAASCVVGALVAPLLAGCGADADPPEAPDFPTSELACEPACRDGLACFDGVCLPSCDRGCPTGTSCQPDGSCVGDLDDGLGSGHERNPCGGASSLPGLPGHACGPCETGRWLCTGADSVTCVDPVRVNACGGCAALDGEPATPCGDEQRWACLPEGGVACLPWLDVNPCGGSEALDHPPGRPCGDCGDGWYACDGPNATVCVEAPGQNGPCDCQPGADPPIACGSEAGRCERGLRFCQTDRQYGSCVVASAGVECDVDDDCVGDPVGYCVHEELAPTERYDDACRDEADPACSLQRCRSVTGTRGCASDDDCAPSQGCGTGFCHPLAVRPSDERCNGIDDDCDGRVDDDDRRGEICGACPFNMRLALNETRTGARRFFCIDHYEASRPDATELDAGSAEVYALSRPDVLPWTGLSAAEALTACTGQAVNDEVDGAVPVKRLCLLDEWTLICGADRGWPYPYGESYVAGMCHDGASDEGAPLPAGSIPECGAVPAEGGFPVFDLSGNVAEWVRGDSGAVIVGGHRTDSEEALSCLAEPVAVDDSALGDRLGFRCCAAPDLSPEVVQ